MCITRLYTCRSPCSSVLLTLMHLWHVFDSQLILIFLWWSQRRHRGGAQRRMEGRGLRYKAWHCAAHASVTDVHVESMSGVCMHQWPAQPGACLFPVWCNPEVIPSCMTWIIVQDESSYSHALSHTYICVEGIIWHLRKFTRLYSQINSDKRLITNLTSAPKTLRYNIKCNRDTCIHVCNLSSCEASDWSVLVI